MKEKVISGLNYLIANLVLLFVGGMIGLLALRLVYFIPVEEMKEHVYQSLPVLEREFDDSLVIPGNEATLTGTFTDCLMIENTIYESKDYSIWQQIFRMQRGESGSEDGWMPGYSLKDYLEGTEQPAKVEYARYWHGYLLFLKPLFSLTTLSSLRIMSGIMQFVLAGLFLILCGKKGDSFIGIAFLLAVPWLYFFTLYFSLSLSICYIVLILALIFQIGMHERLIQKNRYSVFFLVLGMVTVYFDFLTYPLVTLGFPLCVYLYKEKSGLRKMLKDSLLYTIEWDVGYVGLWGMKWVLADIFTGSGTIRDAINTFIARTDSAEGYSRIGGFLSVLQKNIEPYMNWGYFILVLGTGIFLVIYGAKHRENFSSVNCREAISLLIVSLYPFVWMLLTENHMEEHWMFTCKILAITVFACICACGKVFQNHDKVGQGEL